MSDPAVEAAQRAYPCARTRLRSEAILDRDLKRVAEAGAREALAPLREIHRREDDWSVQHQVLTPMCRECALEWPCATAKLIYPEGEL